MHKGTMRNLLVLAGLTVFSGAALAADIARPVYKAPPAGALPVAYDWTGFYVGGHVGYGWAEKDWRDAFGLNVANKGNGYSASTSRIRGTASSAADRSASTIRSASSCSARKATFPGAASAAEATRLR